MAELMAANPVIYWPQVAGRSYSLWVIWGQKQPSFSGSEAAIFL